MIFNGNIHDISINFHTFCSDDLSLTAIGLSTYTLDSIEKYFKRTDPERDYYFSNGGSDVKDKLIAVADPLEPLSCIRFNKETLKYELVQDNQIFTTIDGFQVASSLSGMIDVHKRYSLGLITDDEQKKRIQEVVHSIQSSLSGCITFRTQYVVLGGTRKPQIKIYFQDKSTSDNSREVAHNGSPLIVDIPSRSTGSSYSYRGTQSSPVGIYQKPFQDGINNPNNTIAAPLDIRYNPSIGKWQSGTQQILAKLLTDIDAAQNYNFGLDNIDSIDFNQFYNPDQQQYMSNFTTGLAMPLSLENGNPHQLGPNFIGCPESSQPKIEKIMVVNRSGRTFKKGDIVIASHIDGEWIIQGFDAGTISNKTEAKIGKWSFQKYIVNSDNFFKDARYENMQGIDSGFEAIKNNISPDIYETKVRLKFYRDMFGGQGDSAGPAFNGAGALTNMNNVNNIAKMNMFPDLEPAAAINKSLPDRNQYDIDLNAKYYQSTIFDQLSTALGGTNDHTLIGRTNIQESPNSLTNQAENESYPLQKDIPFFWGPLFPDGYASTQVSRIKLSQTSFKPISKVYINPNGTINRSTGISSEFLSEGELPLINDNESIGSVIREPENGMFSNTTDPHAIQLPAEVALNGINGPFASPIEHPPLYMGSTINTLQTYLNSTYRHSWLTSNEDDRNGIEDVFGLSPIRPHYIQFSPLQLSAALNGIEISPTNPQDINYLMFNGTVNDWAKGLYNTNDIHFHSDKFYQRHNLSKNNITLQSDNATIKSTYRFSQYVKQPTIAPLGGADVIPKDNHSSERGNLFGIIAAKNKFTAPANGNIKLTTRQYFGLTPKVTIAGGQGPLVTVIGAFLSWSTGANPIRENANAQWGDRLREDNYDSNGTTALHVRIFDQWPDMQTIYDGRYFAVLHFNSIPPSGAPSSGIYTVESEIKNEGKSYPANRPWNPSQINVVYQKPVDKATCDVDFRIPTYMHPRDTSIDNSLVPLDSKVKEGGVVDGAGFKALRPTSEWRINPIRRGALLTKGGFKYYKRTIGLNTNDFVIDGGGSRYADGDIINFPKGASVRVQSTSNGAVNSITVLSQGSDFSPPDFAGSGVMPVGTNGNGVGARIFFKSGIVYDMPQHDLGPQERVGITRLSLPSNEGKEPADGSLSTPLSLQGGTGKYDAFYFMHNDILHTLLFDTAFTPGFAQYIDLEIGAG